MSWLEYVLTGILAINLLPAWRAGVNLAAVPETETTKRKRRRYALIFLGVDVAVMAIVAIQRFITPKETVSTSLTFAIVMFGGVIGSMLTLVFTEALISARTKTEHQ